jgi:hypothetical protein
MTIIYNTLKRQPQTNYRYGSKSEAAKAVNPNDFLMEEMVMSIKCL